MRGKRLTSATFIALLLFLPAPSAHAARLLRRMVVVGDSILAGFSSGGLVASGSGVQVQSAPAYVARRAHVSLPQPLMGSPGVPPPLAIVDGNGNGQLDPSEVRRTSDSIGWRARPIRLAHNLAVPGEDVSSVFDTISSANIARRLVTGDSVDGQDVLKFMILGIPARDDSVSQVTLAQEIKPSFLMLWIGNNDVLDMAANTDPTAATFTPDEFGRRFRRVLNALADTNAPMVVANLPDVTGIAALRPAAGDVTSCRQTDGSVRAVTTDELLSIDLPRDQLPIPPCTSVLGPNEQAQVRATVAAYNAEIASAVTDTAQSRGITIAQVDMFALFDGLRQQGVDVDNNGTTDLTTGYLGGIFSLDGIHPTRTGNALIANAFITAIDQTFGEAIPPVDVARVAARDPLVNNAFRPAGQPPFGLIGDENSNAITDFFTNIFDEVSRRSQSAGSQVVEGSKDFFNSLKKFFKRIF